MFHCDLNTSLFSAFKMGIGENSGGLHLFNEFNVTSGSSSKEMVRAFGPVELTILQFFENFGFMMTSLIWSKYH